jgi:1,4-dihydroxy-2-naphthoate octaprenyltransferase
MPLDTDLTDDTRAQQPLGGLDQSARSFLELAGCRYWTASLLPALVGTTLPFWLRPPGFSFRPLPAIEFLVATVLFHAGFSFLQARFDEKPTVGWQRLRLLALGSACLVVACMLGLHLHRGLVLHRGVPGSIFILFGVCALFVGALYVAPPVRFCRRVFGEVVLCEGLGLLPILGAYLVQVGDITRRVYLVSMPLVVATALWIWIDELITRVRDEQDGRETLVIALGPRLAGRLVTLALTTGLYLTIGVAVLSASTSPLALATLLSLPIAWCVVAISWQDYAGSPRLSETRWRAFTLHLITGVALAASSLLLPRVSLGR